MQRLIKTNNRYVRAMFAYFPYLENGDDENWRALVAAHADLATARDEFVATPGCTFQLFGVDQLLRSIEQALGDPARAAQFLANAPTRETLAKIVADEQAKYGIALARYAKDAVKILHWRGKIDGEDIVRICGSTVTVEHLRWDRACVETCNVPASLPRSPGTIVAKNIQSRPLHPFVLEQPSSENGFAAEIYLNDVPGGADWWEFDVYYIPCPPAELGLRSSLRARF
jgi:hypothetical protein